MTVDTHPSASMTPNGGGGALLILRDKKRLPPGIELLSTSELDSIFGPMGQTTVVRPRSRPSYYSALSPLTTEETTEEFRHWRADPRKGDRHKGAHHGDSTTRPIVFVDGEGANIGPPERYKGKEYQHQNYTLISAVFSTGEYRYLLGGNGVERLSTVDCLEFLIGLPRSYVVVGYGIKYDVEQILYDMPKKYRLFLHENGYVKWRGYSIRYIPGKSFSVYRIPRKGKKVDKHQREGMTWWDMVGFFQSRFDVAVGPKGWNLTRAEDAEFLTRMKDTRSVFDVVDEEVIRYNRMEGEYGVRVFERVREEWTNLGLPVRRYDGAGAVAAAMFSTNRIGDYLTQRNPIPTDVMLRAYVGGRFDFSRQGFIGDAEEYDINSAYPNVAANLPCLTHSEWRYTKRYVPSPYSLWRVRWSLREPPWSPFPFRDRTGRIRYYSSGEGWYYGSEVERALLLYPNLQILDGYSLIRSCNHRPFAWVESYYAERQSLKKIKNFGEKVLKLGLNSVYGKLAQSKGHTPKFQCLVWAGMITSGTRAMILEAITHDPFSIAVTATDAVISTAPLPLHVDPTELGAWETKQLSDVCVVGNGLYHTPNGEKIGTRGYDRAKLDWEALRHHMRVDPRPFSFGVPSTEFFGAYPANARGRWDLRCTWEYSLKELVVDVPEWKEERGGWLYPLPNPKDECSYPARIAEENLRLDDPEVLDSLQLGEILERQLTEELR